MLIITTAVSCGRREAILSVKEKKQISVDVRQMLHDYALAIRSKGLLAEFDYLDQSVDFFWVPPGYETAISYDSVAAVLTGNAPSLKLVENSYDSLMIVPLKKDFASYTALITSRVTDTTNRISVLRLVETGLVIKRESGWKLQCGQTSMINPAN